MRHVANNRRFLAAILGIAVIMWVLFLGAGCKPRGGSADKDEKERAMQDNPSEYSNLDLSGKVNAPELSGGHGWLNVSRPLTLKELRGKVVALDFWTFCCINCMHGIPTLRRLERKYPEELVVIGVHSAKFTNEQVTENIREAALSYDVEHPVVNDSDFAIWNAYGVNAWPTIVVIDPDGKIVFKQSGEPDFALLDATVSGLIKKFDGKISKEKIPLALEKDKATATVLAFPGKALVDEKSGRLFVADSGHNRIVISGLDGKVQAIAGSGERGLKDGAFEEAKFDSPQGLLLVGEVLYAADTNNHCLRVLDLKQGRVATVAGNGGQSIFGAGGGAALKTALSSPWDLARIGERPEIYIAMAGCHQIWVYDPGKATVEVFAGTGQEGISDGPRLNAVLAQTSGLATDGTNLYFADSEVSALRMVDFTSPREEVRSLIGTGLFDFGDKDGDFGQALLQHPLGVAYRDGVVYVADTYNHKIKAADLKARSISTLAGTGKPGVGTAETPQFSSPGGLCVAGDKLYIADTNNHAIRVVDVKTRALTTVQFDLSDMEEAGPAVFDIPESAAVIDAGGNSLAAGSTVEITLKFREGFHLNTLGKPLVQLRVTGADGKTWVSRKFEAQVSGDAITFKIETGDIAEPKKIEAGLTIYYCTSDDQGVCCIGFARMSAPGGKEAGKVKLTRVVGAP